MSKRRKLDFYETGRYLVDALLRRVSLGPSVLDPCVGRGAIANPIVHTGRHVFTGDLNPEFDPGGMARDATWWVTEHKLPVGVDVVTNVPFNEANRIVPAFVRAGHRCAFLLRLSWLEPTKDMVRNGTTIPGREEFLAAHPPSGLIVLPRYSFTGDGKTDSVTAAWMLWGFEMGPGTPIAVQPKETVNV